MVITSNRTVAIPFYWELLDKKAVIRVQIIELRFFKNVYLYFSRIGLVLC
jgi:hypothetical protein